MQHRCIYNVYLPKLNFRPNVQKCLTLHYSYFFEFNTIDVPLDISGTNVEYICDLNGNAIGFRKTSAVLNEYNFDLKGEFSNDCINQIEIDIKYDIYIKRQLNDIKQFESEQQTLIPKEINYRQIKGLSNESIDILNQHKPETIRQASQLPGFTSSAVFLLLYHVKNKKTKLA